MIEEPKPLTIKKNWKGPSEKQIKVFENMPTGFGTYETDRKEKLSIDIKPFGDRCDINYVVGAPFNADVATNDPIRHYVELVAVSSSAWCTNLKTAFFFTRAPATTVSPTNISGQKEVKHFCKEFVFTAEKLTCSLAEGCKK